MRDSVCHRWQSWGLQICVSIGSVLSWMSIGNVCAVEPQRLALVVGNSGYEQVPLRNPIHDAQSIAKALRTIDFKVLVLTDADKLEIEDGIDRLTEQLRIGDIGMFYFAGHGVQLENTHYFVPVGVQVDRENHVRHRCVSLQYALDALNDSQGSLKIVVADCCRDNPFRSFMRGSGGSVNLPAAPDGMVVAFSTSPGTGALDGAGNNSPFTKHLANAIESTPEEPLGVIDLFRKVSREVREEVGQRPFLDFDASMPEYRFTRGRSAEKPNAAVKPQNSPPMPSTSSSSSDGFLPPAPAPMAAVEPRNNVPTSPPSETSPIAKEYVNQIGMMMKRVGPGTFLMGSPRNEVGREGDERLHQVQISKPFYIATTEVTQLQWETVMGTKPWQVSTIVHRGPNYPAVMTWSQAVEFCERLSQREGRHYRLPTEAEWEYACRAGTTTRYASGNEASALRRIGHVLGPRKSGQQPNWAKVKSKSANRFGLYDMHGNVWEWCADFYAQDYYQRSPTRDPVGPREGTRRVIRGGAFSFSANASRSANRGQFDPATGDISIGMRIVADISVAGSGQP